jgi:hypothetical protein
MTYRQKTCPTCDKLHKKRGPYCSRSCGNSRVHSEEHKQLLSRKQTEYMYSGTDAAEEARWRINAYDEPERPLPPDEPRTAPNQFVQDGDLWTMD